MEALVDGYPSGLSVGDMVKYVSDGKTKFGVVLVVVENGAFIGETTQQGIRMLRRQEWCPDENVFVEEVNGESMF